MTKRMSGQRGSCSREGSLEKEQAAEFVPIEQQYKLICEALDELEAKGVLPDKVKARSEGRER